jgi:hypothetical protein
MSLTKEMLAAIQKAGSAVFDADAQLKLAVKAYGERVHTAVGSNPYHLGNDILFDNWKMVARLAQTLSGMEEELRKVYQVASEISDDEPSSVNATPALSAPQAAAEPTVAPKVVEQPNLAATDVKIKKKKGLPAAKHVAAKPVPSPKAAPAKSKPAPAQASALPKNAANLLKHLGSALNHMDFSDINQTAISKASAIPLGSMTAALKRLMTDGYVVVGPNGQYKLAK